MNLALFHTARVNVPLFDGLLDEVAPDVPRQHVVDESILAAARRAGGVTPDIGISVNRAMDAMLRTADFVLCTCSTIGALAEQGRPNVLRVDRPMAAQAVALGTRIAIAATLPSTLAPTRDLLAQVASTTDRTTDLVEWHLADAWPLMERGDTAAYAREIARDVSNRVSTDRVDVVVLAQASMASAQPLLPAVGIPVLSTPRLGVVEAIRRLREITRGTS